MIFKFFPRSFWDFSCCFLYFFGKSFTLVRSIWIDWLLKFFYHLVNLLTLPNIWFVGSLSTVVLDYPETSLKIVRLIFYQKKSYLLSYYLHLWVISSFLFLCFIWDLLIGKNFIIMITEVSEISVKCFCPFSDTMVPGLNQHMICYWLCWNL